MACLKQIVYYTFITGLLLAGTVEAGELEKTKPGDTLVFMPGTYDKDHPPTLAPKQFQCYQRMQEAMKAMDPYLNGRDGFLIYRERSGKTNMERQSNWWPDDAIKKQWRQTMAECVK